MTEDSDPMGLLAGTSSEHRYQRCDDEYCDRFPCRVYREGYAARRRRRLRGRLRRGLARTATRTATPTAAADAAE